MSLEDSGSLLNIDFVLAVHDEIIREFTGYPGLAAGGVGGVESALARIETHAYYAGLNDVYGIAALYAVAIARGHIFNDGNKRTALTCALTYLDQQGITIQEQAALEEIMVEVAQGKITQDEMAAIFSSLSY